MYRPLLLLALLVSLAGKAQNTNPAVVVLEKKLAAAKTPEERLKILGGLSKVYINENFRASDSVGNLMIRESEITRDRHLMAEALLVNGERYSYFAGRKEQFEKALSYYNRALDMARENKLDKDAARANLALSALYRVVPDADKALVYVNEALAYLSLPGNDSLLVLGKLEQGNVYLLKRQKKNALQNFLAAREMAEVLKDAILKRACYMALTSFYGEIDDYGKAIDNAVNALRELDYIKEGSTPYNKVMAVNSIAGLYAESKNYEMADYYYQRAIAQADSLHYDLLKIPAYLGILNNYLTSGRPAEALQYLNNNNKIKEFAARSRLSPQIDYGYGYIYTDLGKFDSARYYYTKAAPFFENNLTEASKYTYFYQLGRMYKLSGDNTRSLESFLRAKEVAEHVADPERIKLVAKELDTMYQRTGDYRLSHQFSSLYYYYKDSIEKLGKENDLIKAEADAQQQRQDRIRKEEEDNQRRKNNIQYTAITIGIVLLLIMLVVMGMFRVSAGFIKALGFFAFLMMFEFIFLVFKKNIHSITHGEPWKDLAFMIGLAALLVPLHHWLEHKVLHYLTSHNRLTRAGHQLKNKIFRRNKE